MKYEYVCERATRDAKILNPQDAYGILKRFARKRQEHFVVLTLNGAHSVIAMRVVTIGTANRTMVTARDVFYRAIVDNACAIMMAHNHPSGKLEPSQEDDAITKRIKAAGEIIGIEVLDHLIISKDGHFSYVNSGRINEV